MFFGLIPNPVVFLVGIVLDGILGDPDWLPHPVRGFGFLIEWFDRWREGHGNPFMWGSVLGIGLPVLIAVGVGLVVIGCSYIHVWFGHVVGAYLIWTSVSFRNLLTEVQQVLDSLEEHHLQKARVQLNKLVGRDTKQLDRSEMSTALVETTAEGYLDGVLSPCFWYMVGGPLGMVIFKTVNTMDSMVGYRDDKYREFGTVPARLDDVMNWLPARLSVVVITVSSYVSQVGGYETWRVGWQDRLNHLSPNAAHPEACFSGGLGVTLGGTNTYEGRTVKKPMINEKGAPATPATVKKGMRLYVYSVLMLYGSITIILILGRFFGG
ncbi:MAG: adenosylcobinamide-phosphate synthase CbiB [bacterium]